MIDYWREACAGTGILGPRPKSFSNDYKINGHHTYRLVLEDIVLTILARVER